ncbi:sigma-54-dependent transcriptional regulator [Maritalea mediterranea]|uniref:Sigma-54 dependent transcriptional regulator n=1 Tax=Maritalea mediterranea TaxID=2909667 RepID=A0ABS9E690_9HYPH|nr:sigma-54 dependent transcriptional regulator [Maritalea mediterranea]MCF4097764.1 sigma-54 dependent transcriptional regulator [Maritalea mediterranea]
MPVSCGSSRPPRLLIVDHGNSLLNDCQDFLDNKGNGMQLSCTHVTSGEQSLSALKSHDFDIIFVELNSIGDVEPDAEIALSKIAHYSQGALIIALSEGGSVTMAVAAMRAGAHDYFAKPVIAKTLFDRLEELSARHGKKYQFSPPIENEDRLDFEGFVGASPQMRVIYEQIGRIAPSNAPVFITGESGTGKEVCAEALHARSNRAEGRFVAINCGAIPRDLMETELFGVVKGAFTGAMQDREGAVELANSGTLFLDEIGELDLSLQAKLLRFLQTGSINRVGEAMPRKVDVRIICATNRNPMQMITEKKFREDLFYRLHVLPIHLPPLRQRPADIMPIAETFLARYSEEEGKEFIGFDRETAEQFMAREWPGNVRQIQNLVRRIVVMHDEQLVTARMVRLADVESQAHARHKTVRPAPEVNRHARAQSAALEPLWKQEQRIIEEALALFDGNISQAAAALEISPSTIYRKKMSWEKMEAESAA